METMDNICSPERDQSTRFVLEQMVVILESAEKDYDRRLSRSNSSGESSSRGSNGNDEVRRYHVYKIVKALCRKQWRKSMIK